MIAELFKAGTIANRIRALGLDLQRHFLDLFAASAGDFLDSWFESAPIKAAFGFDSVVGNYASPYAPGSAYVLLHHSFGEVNGRKGVWGHAIGVLTPRLYANLAAAADRAPIDFAELLLVPGIGARTVRALAMVAEVMHGAAYRFTDPARFSFAHGGKDRHPFPVPLRVYDQTIQVLQSAVQTRSSDGRKSSPR